MHQPSERVVSPGTWRLERRSNPVLVVGVEVPHFVPTYKGVEREWQMQRLLAHLLADQSSAQLFREWAVLALAFSCYAPIIGIAC